MKLSQRIFLLFGIPLVIELFLLASLVFLERSLENEVQKEIRSRKLVSLSTMMLCKTVDWARNTIDYRATGLSEFSNEIETSTRDMEKDIKEVVALCDGDAEEEKIASRLRLTQNRLRELGRELLAPGMQFGEVADVVSIAPVMEMSDLLELSKQGMMRIVKLEEHKQKEMHRRENSQRTLLNSVLAMGIGISIFVSLAAAVRLNRSIAKRLKVMVDNTRRLANRTELSAIMKGDDEIAELDKSFHEMDTRLAELMNREQALVTFAVDVICSLDENFHFRNISPAAIRVWGYDPTTMVGKDLFEFVAESSSSTLRAHLLRLKDGKSEVAECEFDFVADQHRLIPSLFSGCWSDSENSYFGVIHDNSERKRVEGLKQSFMAMVSHDLRTPLTSVMLFLELLTSGRMAPDTVESKSKRIHDSVARLIEMINNLLDMEKIQAAKFEIHPEQCHLKELAAGAATTLESYAESKEVQLVVNMPDITIIADPQRVLQVMLNLLGNAIKFAPLRSSVNISAVIAESEVKVSVTDQGPGIEPQAIPHIFDRFEQARAGSAFSGSTGLGLSIAKSLVELHGGTIGVNSRLGEGAEFWFCLPRNGKE